MNSKYCVCMRKTAFVTRKAMSIVWCILLEESRRVLTHVSILWKEVIGADSIHRSRTQTVKLDVNNIMETFLLDSDIMMWLVQMPVHVAYEGVPRSHLQVVSNTVSASPGEHMNQVLTQVACPLTCRSVLKCFSNSSHTHCKRLGPLEFADECLASGCSGRMRLTVR